MCAQAPSKKRKLQASTTSSSRQAKNGAKLSKKGKERSADKGFIEVPGSKDDADNEDSDLGEEDAGFLEEFGDGAGFLNTLDRKGISTCVLS